MNYREEFISKIKQATNNNMYSRRSLSKLSLFELKELSEKLSTKG